MRIQPPEARALPTMWGSGASAVPSESLEEGICKEERGWKLVGPSPSRGRVMGKGRAQQIQGSSWPPTRQLNPIRCSLLSTLARAVDIEDVHTEGTLEPAYLC